ncbi:DUF1289 domain-containing protein [Cupriavidus sp. NPDC089707]|uniref:DUF1289 domain-containing protein n=1 Tax=Cupriavidus sp. NPDC089707 TaxID=3363963 RepID=UPI0037FDC9A9
MNPAAPAFANPCLNICRLDVAGKYCQGCGRTPLEIGTWNRMTEARRAEVLAELPTRQPWRRAQAASAP